MDVVAGRCQELLDGRGPSSIAFYTTGQLFLEEYYTLGLIAHGGINTNHVDGRTRAPATESSGAGGRSVLMWFDSWYELGRILAVGAGAYLTVVLVLRLSGKPTLATLNAFDLTAVSADCWRAAAPPR